MRHIALTVFAAIISTDCLAQGAGPTKPEKQPITDGVKQVIQKYATTYAHATCVSDWIYVRGPASTSNIKDSYAAMKYQSEQQERVAKSMYPEQNVKYFTGTDGKNLVWQYISMKASGVFIFAYLSKNESQMFQCATK